MLSPKKYPVYVAAVVATDVAAIVVSFCAAYWLRFSGMLVPLYKGVPSFESYLHILVVVVPVHLFMFRWYRLYQPERHIRRIHELLSVVKAVTFGTVVLMALTFIYREFS